MEQQRFRFNQGETLDIVWCEVRLAARRRTLGPLVGTLRSWEESCLLDCSREEPERHSERQCRQGFRDLMRARIDQRYWRSVAQP